MNDRRGGLTGSISSSSLGVGSPSKLIRPLRAVVIIVVAVLAASAALSASAPGRPASAAAQWWRVAVEEVVVGPTGGCEWLVPVNAPVVDPFRAPEGPYGAGNRGIEYGTTGGETVIAADGGRVSFAGPVGGRRYVVIDHDGGLRSTYGPLSSISLVRGQGVEAGSAVGLAGRGLHLTARHLGRYLDPGPLLDGVCGRLRLVASS